MSRSFRFREARHCPMSEAMTATEALAFRMAQHGLRQCDVPEIGNQAKVSEVLSGKRTINLRQAVALSKRFGVGVEHIARESLRLPPAQGAD
ncbi:hypothetical protein HHS34_010595 [Acidithiobacillus montserratensis]|uniref:Uncharacterized protein n=1 Tax=Acidithiobacillus montserratensis TaxID=2729135 RepID=A0ACD5HD80_9PROT|nr:hypothetical protein [Acidithiobacillus montserratensis]MBN2678805.1 hypothetical protein [Acidithiobacillaceae bacterium]MBU2748826.1 hypothetical protein [Acidithiobacillus montserratensis]